MPITIQSAKIPRRKPLPRLGWFILGLCLVAVGGGFWYWNKINANQWRHNTKVGIRMPMRYQVHGIDVSHHNAKINWEKVRQMRIDDLRLQFVYIKATEGVSLSDPDFKYNWSKADEVGLYRGAYHFYIAWKTPEPQAEQFIKTVSLKKGDLPPVLDFEVGTNALSRQQVIENLKTWLRLIEDHYGVRPIIYTNANFYKRYIKDNLDDYPLWIADYSGLALNRYDNANILFWQHSKDGSTEGIRGNVDYNVFLEDELKSLVIRN